MNKTIESYGLINQVHRHLEQLFINYFTLNIKVSMDVITSLADNVVHIINFKGNSDDDITIWLTLRILDKKSYKLYNIKAMHINLINIKRYGMMIDPIININEYGFIKKYGFPIIMKSCKKIAYYQCMNCYAEISSKNKYKMEKHYDRSIIKNNNKNCEACNLSIKYHIKLKNKRPYISPEYACPLEKIKCKYCHQLYYPVIYYSSHQTLCKQKYKTKYILSSQIGHV